MARLSLSELTTQRWSFEEDVFEAARRGFDSLGVWRPKIAEFGIEKATELLADQRLGVSSLAWAGGFTGNELRSFDESVSDAFDAVELAATLKAECLIVMAGGRNNHIRGHAMRMLTTALQEVAQVAESLNVKIALEPLHTGCAAEGSFITTIREALEVVGAVDQPSVGIVLDTYHLGLDSTILSWLPDVMKHVRLIQLGDGRKVPMGEANRCLLGDGHVPVAEIIRTAITGGYSGAFELELCGEDIEHLSYQEVLDASQAFFNDAVASVSLY